MTKKSKLLAILLYTPLMCCAESIIAQHLILESPENTQNSTITPQSEKNSESITPPNVNIGSGTSTSITEGTSTVREASTPSSLISPTVTLPLLETSTSQPSPKQKYSTATFASDLNAIKWDAIGAFTGITALGLKSWKWGNTGFHFGNEKWFQKDRSSIGMDKLGHAFTSYTMTNLFAEHLQRKGRSEAQSAISAAILTQALMLYVEAFDGFSSDHGFSYEDVIMNLAGTSLAYARQRYPRVKELIDYRMEYTPSGYKGNGLKGFRPISDYAGQKYHLAFKFGGVHSLRNTPFKYLELHAGYYARGFTPQEEASGIQRTRTGFVGLGLNLSELFFGARSKDESTPVYAGRTFLEHIQLPVYAASKHPF